MTEQGTERANPTVGAPWWRLALLSYLSPMVRAGRAGCLEERDVYRVEPGLETRRLNHRFDQLWTAELQRSNGNPSLPRIMWTLIGPRNIYLAMLYGTLGVAAVFALPLVLRDLVSMLETLDAGASLSPSQYRRAFIDVLLFLLLPMVSTIAENQAVRLNLRSATLVAATTAASVYSKALRLSAAARRATTSGKIVNLMSADTEVVFESFPNMHHAVLAPFQILVALVLLGVSPLGWTPTLAGLATIFLLIPINGFIAAMFGVLSEKKLKLQDERVKMTAQLLNGIRIVKYYAWENQFLRLINAIRSKEVVVVRNIAIAQSALFLVIQLTTNLIILSIFSLYAQSNAMTASVVFTSIALFELLRGPVFELPLIGASLYSTLLSFKRLRSFLLLTDMPAAPFVTSPPAADSLDADAPAILMQEATFSWAHGRMTSEVDKHGNEVSRFLSEDEENDKKNMDKKQQRQQQQEQSSQSDDKGAAATLADISLSIKPGQLVAVVGQIASGKSSLLSAMLGDLPRVSGDVQLRGSVAYVPQQAWILNATVRDNVLFGAALEAELFDAVVDAAALRADIDLLPAGVDTEIGERGVNLSGGQKQRISLARALYARADIVLLDDPLSAVDAHVGKHLFDHALLGFLGDATRILVTNQLQYLSAVDLIILMADGCIAEVGTFDELTRGSGTFALLMQQHGGQAQDQASVAGAVAGPVRGDAVELASTNLVAGADAGAPATAAGADGAQAGLLVAEEDAETGAVSWRVYRETLALSGGAALAVVFLALLVLNQVLSNGVPFWLAYWTAPVAPPPNLTPIAAADVGTPLLGYGVSFFLLVMVLLIIADGASILARGFVFAHSVQRGVTRLHHRLIGNVLRLPMSFFETTPSGRVLNRFSRDTNKADFLVPDMISSTLLVASVVLSLLVGILLVAPILILVVAPSLLVIWRVRSAFIGAKRDVHRIKALRWSPVLARFAEAVNGAPSIRAYQVMDRFVGDNYLLLDRHSAASQINSELDAWVGIRMDLVAGIISGTLAAVLISPLNQATAGYSALALSFCIALIGFMGMLALLSALLESSMNSVQRILEYAKLPQEPPAVTEHRPPADWPMHGAICFRNYSLRYRAGLDLVLHNVCFDVAPREKIGVVGRTGAGKSSLLAAMFRLVEPAAGTILIDDVDITKIGLCDLRSRLAIIPQDPVLFAGTMRINLDPGSDVHDDELWRVLQLVGLDTAVRAAPAALAMPIDEGGSNLSLGQRQLVCVARALLRRPRVLLMDEATASVDVETDMLMQRMVRKHFADATVITIAHRLNTIMDSTRILVMDQGRVSEFASPAQLLDDQSSLLSAMVDATGRENAEHLRDLAYGRATLRDRAKRRRSRSSSRRQSSRGSNDV